MKSVKFYSIGPRITRMWFLSYFSWIHSIFLYFWTAFSKSTQSGIRTRNGKIILPVHYNNTAWSSWCLFKHKMLTTFWIMPTILNTYEYSGESTIQARTVFRHKHRKPEYEENQENRPNVFVLCSDLNSCICFFGRSRWIHSQGSYRLPLLRRFQHQSTR